MTVRQNCRNVVDSDKPAWHTDGGDGASGFKHSVPQSRRRRGRLSTDPDNPLADYLENGTVPRICDQICACDQEDYPK